MGENRLIKIRESKGLSGTKIAEDIGISPQYYYDLEKGKRRLKGDMLIKLANYLNVSTDYILGNDQDNTDIETKTFIVNEKQYEIVKAANSSGLTDEAIIDLLKNLGKYVPKKNL